MMCFLCWFQNRLCALEVKTGARPDYSYAGQQIRELKRYLQQDILGHKRWHRNCAGRSLFVRCADAGGETASVWCAGQRQTGSRCWIDVNGG